MRRVVAAPSGRAKLALMLSSAAVDDAAATNAAALPIARRCVRSAIEAGRNLCPRLRQKTAILDVLALRGAKRRRLGGPRPPRGSLEAFSEGAGAPSFARNGAGGAAQHPINEIRPRGLAARRAAAIGDRGLQLR